MEEECQICKVHAPGKRYQKLDSVGFPLISAFICDACAKRYIRKIKFLARGSFAMAALFLFLVLGIFSFFGSRVWYEFPVLGGILVLSGIFVPIVLMIVFMWFDDYLEKPQEALVNFALKLPR